MSSTFTSHQKSTSPKSTLSLSLNCFNFSHNSQNDFDNHFDAHSKYPLTNTSNKLSDNYKIHQKLSKHEKNTSNSRSFTTHSQLPSNPNSPLNQAFKQLSLHHKPASKTPLDTELTSKPYYPHKNHLHKNKTRI